MGWQMIEFAIDNLRSREDRVLRVKLDGQDVTKGCLAFDQATGFVAMVVKDETGRRVIDPRTGTSRKMFKRGNVEVERGRR